MGLGVIQAGEIKPLGPTTSVAEVEPGSVHVYPQGRSILAYGEGPSLPIAGARSLAVVASERQGQLS